jgi:hypothetical protein
MQKRLFTRSGAVVLALSFGMVSPVLAQAITKGAEGVGTGNSSTSAMNQNEQGPDAGQTGIGQRGTKVAPSTEPGKPSQPKTADTGVQPRGTKVAPSTNPGQSGEQMR